MLNSIASFFTRTFRAIGRVMGLAVAFVQKPFIWLGSWFGNLGVILKVLRLLLLDHAALERIRY
jgi:hypothetical protein